MSRSFSDAGMRGGGPPNIDGMVTLKIDNIPYNCTVEEIRYAFERCGDLGDVYIPRDLHTGNPRGFAFVRFMDQRDADYAIDRMDGEMLGGRQLRIQYAKRRRPEYDSHRRGGYDDSRRGRSRSREHRRSRSRSYSRHRRHRGSRRSRSRSQSHDKNRISRHHSPSPPSRRRQRSYSRSPSPRRRSKSPPRSISHSPRKMSKYHDEKDDHRGDDKHRDYAHTEPNGHSDAANGNGTSNGGHRDDASESPRRSHR